MVRKKFINEPDLAVDDCLRGVVLANARLTYHPQNPRVILRKDLDILKASRVTIACGGGSGHEPFTAGLVGENGVSAAICGDVFASPPALHVKSALEAIYSPKGTFIFCNNYTGDRLNFGMAVERFKANKLENAKLELIYIDDDVALEGRSKATTGRRGLAGCILVMHMIGVLADEKRATFEEISTESQRMIHSLGTFGVSLYPCALPGRDYLFEMPDDEMELGLGIHAEPGIQRLKMRSARETVDTMMLKIMSSKRMDIPNENKRIPLAVLLNNLGSTSQLEMGVLQGEIIAWLTDNNFNLVRFYVGTVTSSLDGHGVSVSVLKVIDDRWLLLLDTPGQVSSLWYATRPAKELPQVPTPQLHQKHVPVDNIGVQVSIPIAEQIRAALLSACEALLHGEDLLNRLDSVAGDGDCGVAFRRAAKAIIDFTDNGKLNFARPKALCLELSDLFEQAVGGTTGAIYALFFSSAANAFSERFDGKQLRSALREALKSIGHFGRATPGNRTMVDALVVAANADPDQNWGETVKAVELAAEETADMLASSGRASYTSKERQNLPDAGAKAVAIWFRAAYDSIVQNRK